MQHVRLISLAFLFSLLGACAGPQTPQQAVFQTKSAYEVGLTTAVAYKRLPVCQEGASGPQLCSKKTVVTQLQKADDVAAKALDAAENTVRTPGFGESIVQSAVTAARAALDAFVAIVNTLQVK